MDIRKLFDQFFGTGTQPKVEQPVVQQEPTQQPTQLPEKPDYYERLKMAESSGRADVKSKTSSATGHHQFIEGTWKALTTKYNKPYTLDDRKDPAKSLEVAKLFTEENKSSLQKALKREPTDTELYAAHFLGTSGAKKFLMASPFTKASKVVNKNQVKSNKNIFYDGKTGKERTVSEVYEILKKKIGEE
jgi:hypothetical protein